MAYHIDGTDIVIDGWENGISDNPYQGINDMRGVNIISIPGEASVSFAQTNTVFPSSSGTVASADAGTDVVTFSGVTGTLKAGQALVFTGASLPAGITAGNTYWIFNISGLTAKLYTDPHADNLLNITGNGTGTFASINMGEITYFEKKTGVALDKNGRVWEPFSGKFLGNSVSGTVGLSGTIGNGLIWYKNYLFVFYNSRICYTPFSGETGAYVALAWVNEWNPATGAADVGTEVFNTTTGTGNPHEALVGQDDVVYITDSNYVASLFEKAGQTFDPTNTATYTWNNKALKIPSTDKAICLEELGKNLMVGGTLNYIYPWDRVSVSFDYPMKIADNYTYQLLTVNTNMYIFAGRRGRIYVTNGQQANLYKKVPDHISGIEPIFQFNKVCYNKNQIYFGLSAKNNAQSDITSYCGLWAIDITTDALRVPTIQSNTTADVTAVFANPSASSGFGLLIAWKNDTTYGIDSTISYYPYTTYTSYIETDLIPVGQFLKKKTFDNLELKLSKALVDGEGIKISCRTIKDGTYVQIGETLGTSTVTPISDYYTMNFDQSEWLQFKIEMKSVQSSPTYVRLKELRLRSSQQ